jgi:hypothetical protein
MAPAGPCSTLRGVAKKSPAGAPVDFHPVARRRLDNGSPLLDHAWNLCDGIDENSFSEGCDTHG